MTQRPFSKIAVAFQAVDRSINDVFNDIILDLKNVLSKTHPDSYVNQGIMANGVIENIAFFFEDTSEPYFEVLKRQNSMLLSISVPENLVEMYEAIILAQRNLLAASFPQKEEFQQKLNEAVGRYHLAIQKTDFEIISNT